MNIIIMNNKAGFLVNFWRVLILRLREEGHEVICLVPAGDPEAETTLRNLGAEVWNYPLDNKSLNPLHDLKTCIALYGIFKKIKGDILYASTIKSVVYGLPMATLAGTDSCYAMITGLGYMFEANSPIKKALTCLAALLYRIALTFSRAVFFQNTDDIKTFRQWHCLPSGAKIVLTRGTGVDTAHFSPVQYPEGDPLFLFVGRLLEAKGLYEFAEAARIVKRMRPDACFGVLGAPEPSRGGVPMTTVQGWEREGILTYLGVTRDVRPYIAKAAAVVLPSWGEGLPCSLMEAMSMGRAIVATDVPGCRDVVRTGCNGLLVPAHNPQALADALLKLAADHDLAREMGRIGRNMAENELDARKAADLILKKMNLI